MRKDPLTNEEIEGLQKRIQELEGIAAKSLFFMTDGWSCPSMITKEEMRDLGLKCKKAMGLPHGDLDWP